MAKRSTTTTVSHPTLKFETAGSKINRGISMIIYCDPGIGKTTLATTLPPLETLIINTEAGLGPILGKGHTIFNLNEDLTQLDSLYKFLRTGDHPFKYVVVDNISELEQWFVVCLTKGRSKDFAELSEYGNAGYKMREYIHLFRDLIDRGITVVFNAWEMQLELKNLAGEVVTKTCPKMFKKIAPDICGIVDMIGHLEYYEKTGDRWIRFAPKKDLIAKSQYKGIDNEEPADLVAVLEKVYGHDYSTGE